jgi:hypothetical protein
MLLDTFSIIKQVSNYQDIFNQVSNHQAADYQAAIIQVVNHQVANHQSRHS